MDFRPKLPANPFGDVPWVLDVDVLDKVQKTAVLVLNTPSPADLHALVCASPALRHSLVLIATHEPPILPASASVLPTVRVLILKGPLFDRGGALGLMSVLDKAARFASSPLATGGGIQIYSEDPATGEFSVREEPGASRPETSIQHPALMLSTTSVSTNASSSSESALKKKKRRTFNFFTSPTTSPASSPSPSLTSLPFLSSPPPLPLAGSPSQHASSRSGGAGRPFDTIIHYLPSPSPSLPEKAILKQAILVMTLSAPYLAAPPDPPKYLRLPQRMNTVTKRGSKMAESRSMPRLRGTGDDATMDGDAVGPRTRRSTLALRSKQPSEEDQENGVIEPSASTGSFKALKRRVTMSLRRKSSVVPNATLAPEVDNRKEHGEEVKEKRVSTLNRGSGTQRKLLRNHSSAKRTSMFSASADESGFLVIGEDDFTPQYVGRSHVIHVVPLNVSAVSSPPTSPNPNRSSVGLARSPPSPSPRNSVTGKAKMIQKPSSKPLLVKSIEQFLVAFAYPVQSLGTLSTSATPPVGPSPTGSPSNRSSVISVTGLGTPSTVGGEHKSVPFIVKSGSLAACLSTPPSLEAKSHRVVEWILFGGLDNEKELSLSPKVWLDVDSAVAGGHIVCGGAEGQGLPVPVVVSFDSSSTLSEGSLDEEGHSALASISEHLHPSKPLGERRTQANEKVATPQPRSSSLEPPRATPPQLITPESSVSSGSPPSPTGSGSPLSKANEDTTVTPEAKEQPKLKRSEVISDYRRYYHLPRSRPRSRSRSKERPHNEGEEQESSGEGRGERSDGTPTGLLTPPDSESSSSEGGHDGDDERQRRKGNTAPSSANKSAAAEGVTTEEEGNTSNTTATSTTTNGTDSQHTSFDSFVRAYLYDRGACPATATTAEEHDGAAAAEEPPAQGLIGRDSGRNGSTATPPVNNSGSVPAHASRGRSVEASKGEPTEEDGREGGKGQAAFVGDVKTIANGSDVGESATRGDHDASLPSRAHSSERTLGDSGSPAGGLSRNHGRLFNVTAFSKRGDDGLEQPQGRSRSVSSSRRSAAGGAPEEEDGMGTKEAQEYANALRKYREDLFGANVSANMDEGQSIRSVGSAGSSNLSPRREACSLAGVPPVVGGGGSPNAGLNQGEEVVESEEVQMERWERRQREKREKRERDQERKERDTAEVLQQAEKKKEQKRMSPGSPLRHQQPNHGVVKAESSSEAAAPKYHYRKSIRRDEGRYNLAKDAEGPQASQSPLLQEPKFLLTPAMMDEGSPQKVVMPRERKSSLLTIIPRERKSSLNTQESGKRKANPFGGLVGFGKALLGGSKAG
ncbi:hypothetical protein MD484_g7773, partial [Candolleomyces efflorescens]